MKIISLIIRKSIHYLGNALRGGRNAYLRAAGVKIGKDCMISLRAKFDVRRGQIIIGDNCTITFGCILVSHDRSAMHINPEDDGEGRVVIGDNVYLGVGTIVLRNVSIGDNSVIGAGSVVIKDIPPNVIAVGNPAKIIKTIDRIES